MNKQIQNHTIKKILIIKLRGIGDVVLSTIVLDNLKEEYPNSTIDFLTEAPSKPLLDGLSTIDNVLLFERKSSFKRFKLMLDIRNRRYDLVLDLFSNPASAQVTFLSGARYRAGFPYKGRKYAYNLYGPKERGIFHSADLHLKFLSYIGITNKYKKLSIFSQEHHNLTINNKIAPLISSNKLVIGISPSGGWESKKCEPSKFVEIAKKIRDQISSEFLIVWGPGDEDYATQIHEKLSDCSTLAPKTSISEMTYLISLCKLLIANDSGPMHISTAIGVPTLSLHGPTNPHLQGPYGDKNGWVRNEDLDCIECNLLICPKNKECFNELNADKVVKKVKTLLDLNQVKHETH